uniref:Glycosyltransferase n=1 Tax=viral metagenome TaxID=1070528 RepID=A0A6C0D6G5_9ZZZZ
MGGIGNQLFQYAAGFLQKKVSSSNLVLCKPENSHDSTDYRYLFTEGISYNGDIPLCKTLYQENGFLVWDPENYNGDTIILYGYFQNYNVLKTILPEFKTHILLNLEHYKKFKIVSNSGFIHVRRGDYLNKSNSHHIQPLEYYEKAIRLMSHISHWYVLSDDLEWCKSQELFNSLNVTYVNEDTLHSLALMTMICKGAIIANSSFSWWGAYLGCGEKNVIYPKLWFEDVSPDLFPEDWVGL